ncbi:MAG: HipA domain-containing protein [Myxococcales bacterium]|nr:HipA domain-containing protein [Myxococcales bacterium]
MSTLDVLLGTTRVGALEQFEDEEYVFTFDPAWLADPQRPVLGQLFEDRRPRDIAVSGPPCWFAHLLPQGPLRRAIARQSGHEEADVFSLLQLLGEDLPGAVILRAGPSRLSRAPASPLPIHSPGPLRFSLAGAQWKLSVREGERGLTLPVDAETGRWIAKFHDPQFRDLPRVELATMTWARLSGIDTPAMRQGRAAEIVDLPAGVPVGDGTIFLIERFDRGPDQQRIHMEDFGQVLDRPPGHTQFVGSYELIAAVLAALTPIADLRAFCERLVFCVLAGNTDAHLKNWSLLYPDSRHPRLAPAYDLIASVLYIPEARSTLPGDHHLDDELALELGGSRRFEAVDLAAFSRLASACDLDSSEVAGWVRDAAQRVRAAWSEHASSLPLMTEERARLERHLARIRLP